jgi:hypothetical protein
LNLNSPGWRPQRSEGPEPGVKDLAGWLLVFFAGIVPHQLARTILLIRVNSLDKKMMPAFKPFRLGILPDSLSVHAMHGYSSLILVGISAVSDHQI